MNRTDTQASKPGTGKSAGCAHIVTEISVLQNGVQVLAADLDDTREGRIGGES